MDLRYYKGEKSNPFEEVNEKQGAWCNRYNPIASAFWFFEYHWANGWSKYSKLEVRRSDLYFEAHKEPQKDFSSLEDALCAFVYSINDSWAQTSCSRWCTYLHENGTKERFYKPAGSYVPADEVPSYLHWYRGEGANPFEFTNSTKSFWWGFEYAWYKSSEKPTKNGFESYLEEFFARRWHSSTKADGYTEFIEKAFEAYRSGTPSKAVSQ
ncbi:MAG: hypothetical protein Q4E59_03040 [Bacteroidales bacterium]|nr:hypothetical protein [Bacteroidales bacterium]